ncbi:MAG: type II toxin-antitoxin system PemK/MazF family toxin, partial [Smithellaceae bacterium]|nr:type II toxin-antitoxin system PemK/MazF family toxin [Smithellaceae bacterium]
MKLQENFHQPIWRIGMNIKRGNIYLAALDPTVGREIAKTRPVVVVSNDQNNIYAGTVSILPLTSKNTGKIYPFETLLSKGAANLPNMLIHLTPVGVSGILGAWSGQLFQGRSGNFANALRMRRHALN